MKALLKKVDNIYEGPISFEKVFVVWKIIKKTCKNKKAVFNFSLNKNTNIYNVYKVLKEKKYKPLPFRLFLIFEPKPRLVMSQTISDKIINHYVANNYLLPYLESRLIDQNVATRKGKGSEYANKLIIDYINKIRIKDASSEIYCLKIDISKYFYSINHEILINKIEKIIKDKNVLNIIKIIINETNQPYVNEKIKKFNKMYHTEIPFYDCGTGLSIGAMTSQFLAIFYLNDLDHFIKEKLKCKYYIRYMDDFLIFDTNRKRLKEDWQIIETELVKIKLKMNPKSGLYRLSSGISFLGYSYKTSNKKLILSYRKKTYKKIKRKLKILKEKDKLKYYHSYASYYGYLNKIVKQERKFKMKTQDKYEYYKEKYPNYLIFINEGIFYKTFKEDAILVWYLFNYSWKNDSISFGAAAYTKVLDRLNQLEISCIIISSTDEIQTIKNDIENYELYLKLANKSYKRFKEKAELIELFNKVIDENPNYYDLIKRFLNEVGDVQNDKKEEN